MDKLLISLFSLGGIAFAFGLILSILDKRLRVEEDSKIEEVLALLPGINCGACGFKGCRDFAQAVVKENNIFGGCLPGGEEVNKRLAKVLGIEGKSFSSKKVVVLCLAEKGEKYSSFEYRGPETCFLANISLANIDCRYGCLGFGDCVEVCPTQALKVEKGKVIVDYKKCIGCGKCVEVCPRGILKLIDKEDKVYVGCSNQEKAASTKKVCSKGCIGCGLCAKLIKNSPFYLEEGLAKIDYSRLKTTPPEEVVKVAEKCPVKVIKLLQEK
ncbi:MAG TPA: RnfABCDGE type electron transport complex subunit B [Candidatus Omnitrophica bacterium]|nr:MAG: electron transporter RnfB [Candidatus Omnitrophota bacterium]RKY44268.1 MAG: electron transporter RnfB [Candidatus Omnitrophota bacterium]HEC69883.1 RnfABCDGE type electron transport complex subunit B [Candidatus Omnitrophota bacterium]